MNCRRALLLVTATAGLALAPAATAAAAPPTPGGCQDFGAYVASLAKDLGGAFGATASSVASSAPRAFPSIVVHPEQAEFCG